MYGRQMIGFFPQRQQQASFSFLFSSPYVTRNEYIHKHQHSDIIKKYIYIYVVLSNPLGLFLVILTSLAATVLSRFPLSLSSSELFLPESDGAL